MKIAASNTAVKIASNTAFQLVGKVVSMTITVLATVIITRMYGREGYGAFNIMQNFPALFFIIVDFGLNAIATRELSKDWEKAEKYLGNIIILRLLLSAVIMIFCFFILYLFPYDAGLRLGVQLCLLLILTQALYACTNVIFQVKLRYDLSTIGYIAGSIVVLILVLILSYLRASVTLVSFTYVIGGLVTFIINMFFIHKLGVKISFKIDTKLWGYLLIQTLPLGLMFIFSQINFKADSVLISILKLPANLGLDNTESVAIYGLSYKVFEVALVLPTFFMNAAYPLLVRHMTEGKNKLRSTFSKVLISLLGVGIIGSVLGVLFAPWIIQVLGGAEFGQSVDVLRLLMAGMFIFYLTSPLAWLIVTLGKQKYLPLIYLVSAVFNVTMNLIFIPTHSFYASSVLTWSSEVIVLILLTFFALKSWKLKYSASLTT